MPDPSQFTDLRRERKLDNIQQFYGNEERNGSTAIENKYVFGRAHLIRHPETHRAAL